MFSSIIDPYTKTKVSLFGQEGGKLLENYIKVYKNIYMDLFVYLL